ncbi:MAG TPA: alpha/beta hydrolase [Thermomicrobiales bacterium]|nr:alpha/beta hydrolase [Thermomicrobiales bacterium]
MTTPRDGFVSANGLTLHYLDWGGAGPPLVLLHGLRDQAHGWDEVAPLLVPHGRVLALDQRGHGGSDRPPAGYAPEDFAADVAAFCAVLDLRRPVIVGHSLGGRTALTLAGLRPGLARGYVIVDVGARGDAGVLAADVARLRDGYGPFGTVEDAVAALVGPGRAPNAATRRYVAYNLRPTGDGRLAWRYDLDAAVATLRLGRPRDFSAAAAAIGVPVLLVRGGRSDVLSREEAARVAALIPDCTLVELPGVGHLVPQVRPAALAAAIVAWLPRVV